MTHMNILSPVSFKSELSHGVLTVTLDRPERINALTFEVYRELREFFVAVSADVRVRVVVLRGAGDKGFCSGGDVRDIIAELFPRDLQGLLEFTRMTGALVEAIRTTRPPVIAALHGVICGAGAVIAAACDLRIASNDARIAFLFPKVGLSGADMGASYLLPRLIGLGRASELLLFGDFVVADDAYRMGLFNKVVDKENLFSEAASWAQKLSDGPAFAHAMTKRMLEYEEHVDFHTGIEAEAQAQAICMQHPDFREAYDASVGKRAPKFK